MFKAPYTYNEWMDCLDGFRDEKLENEALYAMMNGRVDWQSGVAERLTKSIFDVIQYKLNIMQDNFNKRISKPAKSNMEIEKNLLYARRVFKKLLVLSELKVFPEELRKNIEKSITDTADSMQNSLLDSAKRDRTGVITSLVKKNAVNRLTDVEVNTDPIVKNDIKTNDDVNENNKVPVGARRRIIF